MIATLRRHDPVLVDRYRRGSADALRALGVPPKVLARQLGVSPRYIRMILAGARDNPLAAAAAFIGRLARCGYSVWSLLAYLSSEAVGALMRMDDAALRANLHDLIRACTHAQCALTPLMVEVRDNDPQYLARLEQAFLEQARRCEEGAATSRELRRSMERQNGRQP